MQSHDLARLLLSMPDAEIGIQAPATSWLARYQYGPAQGLRGLVSGSYPAPSWEEDAGQTRPVVVLQATEETLSEDEAFDKG